MFGYTATLVKKQILSPDVTLLRFETDQAILERINPGGTY